MKYLVNQLCTSNFTLNINIESKPHNVGCIRQSIFNLINKIKLICIIKFKSNVLAKSNLKLLFGSGLY